MRFRPTDPISPSFSPTVPTVHQALMQIELELASVRIEQPEWTPHQQLAEARPVLCGHDRCGRCDRGDRLDLTRTHELYMTSCS
jgi:hypothetical protein